MSAFVPHATSTSPPPLSPGDRVAVVSPAGPVLPEHTALGVETLESWGLVPVLMGAHSRDPDRGYFAGPDAERLGHLQAALDDPDIKAVFCARGGYGAMRLLDGLDLSAVKESPKWLVGFSDVTALHLKLAGEGLCTLHAPVLKSFRLHADDPHGSVEALRRVVFGEEGSVSHTGLKVVRAGSAEGRAMGGNLSLVVAMIGSAHAPDLNGSVLFLEDIGEVDYRLDRLFTALRLSEKCRAPAAIVLGDFTDCGGVYVPDEGIPAFVEELAGEFGCPVVAGFPMGHASRNVPVPMGAPARVVDGVVEFGFQRY